MAKRFTDTDKWKRTWYSGLNPLHKLVWNYILDDCDSAGVWCANFRRLSFDTGTKITREQFESIFTGKVFAFSEDKYFIPSFIDFQYGELREDSRPHASVIKQLKKHGLFEGYLKGIYTLSIGLAKGIDTLKDKEQEQDKEQDKEKEKGSEVPEASQRTEHFDALYKLYPRHEDKAEARKRFEKYIGQADLLPFSRAVGHYAAVCTKRKTEIQFVKLMASFIGSDAPNAKGHPWKDFVERPRELDDPSQLSADEYLDQLMAEGAS